MKREEALIRIREIASEYKWIEIDHQENICMVSFIKSVVFAKIASRINVYYGKPHRFTVATTVDHPWTGRKQLYRKFINFDTMIKIFQNPRQHTTLGYYRNKKPWNYSNIKNQESSS